MSGRRPAGKKIVQPKRTKSHAQRQSVLLQDMGEYQLGRWEARGVARWGNEGRRRLPYCYVFAIDLKVT